MQKNIIIVLLAILVIVSGIAVAVIFWPKDNAPGVELTNNLPGGNLNPDVLVKDDTSDSDDPEIPAGTNVNDEGGTQEIGSSETNVDLIVDFPQSNSLMLSPYVVSGKAKGWYFEGEFPVKLVDSNSKVLATGNAKSKSDWMVDAFVPFQVVLNFNPGDAKSGKLIFEKANPSGLAAFDKKVEVAVKFATKMTVKAYFLNTVKNPKMEDCGLVYPVERTIAPTLGVGSAALDELLKGPTALEQRAGYKTAINEGVKLNKLTIVNGVAKADFASTLEEGVGGSCRVLSIRSQIEQTLKQFPTVKTVEITINGKGGDRILQP